VFGRHNGLVLALIRDYGPLISAQRPVAALRSGYRMSPAVNPLAMFATVGLWVMILLFYAHVHREMKRLTPVS
jgi:hypothetical protein